MYYTNLYYKHKYIGYVRQLICEIFGNETLTPLNTRVFCCIEENYLISCAYCIEQELLPEDKNNGELRNIMESYQQSGIDMKDDVFLFNFCVHKDYRKKGYGTKLLEKVLKYYTKKGKQRIFLHVYANNEAGLGLYRKFQFPTYRMGNDYLIMYKKINENDIDESNKKELPEEQ